MHTISDLSLSSECNNYHLKFFEFNEDKNGYIGEVVDCNNNKMPFVFRPGKDIRLSRTLIILHGHGANTDFSKYKDDNWNVIVPLDKYGTEGYGSWWLGENGDFKTYHLLQNLIKILNANFKFSNLYFWGSSMGGYGAIVHGFELRATAIYAHIPQTKLKNTDYTDGANSKFYHPIFKEGEESIYEDLNKFISRRKLEKSPVLFLSQTSKDAQHYVDQHFLNFIRTCNKKGFAFSVQMPLVSGHVGYLNVAQTVKTMFEDNYKKIKKWRIEGKI